MTGGDDGQPSDPAAQMAWLNGGNQGLQEWFANDLEQNYFRSAGILAHVPIDINELH